MRGVNLRWGSGPSPPAPLPGVPVRGELGFLSFMCVICIWARFSRSATGQKGRPLKYPKNQIFEKSPTRLTQGAGRLYCELWTAFRRSSSLAAWHSRLSGVGTGYAYWRLPLQQPV
jgi:hypothetical protein